MSIVSIDIDTDTGRPVDYWTVGEFAKVCGVEGVTVRKWIRRHKVDSIMVGNANYILIGTPKPDPIIREGRHHL